MGVGPLVPLPKELLMRMMSYRRTLTGVCVLSTVLVAGATGVAGSAAAAAPIIEAQIVSDNLFLSNGIVEFGSRPNGSFGSDASAPSGYHPNTDEGTILGFVSDRDRDGWGVGTDDGDFFAPGSPYEGWGLQVGSEPSGWNSNGPTAVPGAWAAPLVSTGSASGSWTAGGPVNGLAVSQKVTVPAGQQYLNVNVTLTNTSATALTDVAYARGLDPDNCLMRTTAVCDQDTNDDGVGDTLGAGNYQTQNTVVSQLSAGDPASVVSATQSDGSYLDLRSSAPGAAVYMGTDDSFCTEPEINSLSTGTALEGGDSQCAVTGARGTTRLLDDTFFLVVNTPTLAAGMSRTFSFQYVLNRGAADTLNTPPTAQPDTGNTPQDTNITVPVLTNDTPSPLPEGGPGSFDSASVVFTSPSATNAGRTLQVPGQGAYTINPATGAVTFDPEPGFTGQATPVAYAVTDTNNKTAGSTVTITVTANPTPAPTPSPTPSPTPDDSFDLALSKRVISGARATVGDRVRYRLQVSNKGPAAAPARIKLTDALPKGLDLVSAHGKGWKCTVRKAADTVSCVRTQALGADRKARAVFVVAVATKAAMGRVVNVANVSVAGQAASAGDRDKASITVVPAQLPSTGLRTVAPGS